MGSLLTARSCDLFCLQALCNGDIDRMLKFEVFDYDDDGTHDYAVHYLG